MKKLLSILFAALCLNCHGQQLVAGQNFVDGQRLTAAQLMALVNLAVIQPLFYSGQVSQTNMQPGDTVLVLSGASGTFHKVTGSGLLFQNYQLISGQSGITSLPGYDQFIVYDPSNNVFHATTASVIASNSVAAFGFTNLAQVTLPISTFDSSNQWFFTGYQSNGVLSSLSLSNLSRLLTLSIFPSNFYDTVLVRSNLTTSLTTNTYSTNAYVVTVVSPQVTSNGVLTNSSYSVTPLEQFVQSFTNSPSFRTSVTNYISTFATAAWAKWNGVTAGTVTPLASVNVSNIVHLATGYYKVVFSNAMTSTNYGVFINAMRANGEQSFSVTNATTTNVTISSGRLSWTPEDENFIYIQVIQ